MLELLITLHLYTITPKQITTTCKTNYADGCIILKTNSIYISKSPIENRQFVIYHEIGHSLYRENNFPKELYTDSFSPAREQIADDFAFYIYNQSKPNSEYGKFYQKNINKDRDLYFKKTCPEDCVNTVIKFK